MKIREIELIVKNNQMTSLVANQNSQSESSNNLSEKKCLLLMMIDPDEQFNHKSIPPANNEQKNVETLHFAVKNERTSISLLEK